jgi:23S rRNA G2445 N2-methylase RlmL
MRTDNELYRRLRALSCADLWSGAVADFARATPGERQERVAVVRAVGLVFSRSGTSAERAEARAWLRGLLGDPSEKVRRYAIAALPKLDAGADTEAALLALLRASANEREKKAILEALAKIGSAATLAAVAGDAAAGELVRTAQTVRARVVRKERPSALRLERAAADYGDLRLCLRCRDGLEDFVAEEARESAARGGKFLAVETRRGAVVVAPTAPFSFADVYELRCFGTVGVILDVVRGADLAGAAEGIAAAIVSPMARRVMTTWTEGSLRYRLSYVEKGRVRDEVRRIADRAYALCPDTLNDAREAPWAIDIHPGEGGFAVELRPRITPDPRFAYRGARVPGASYPPLAACMVRLAGCPAREVVWDPCCGTGVELIERARLGGVEAIYGTDLDANAAAIAARTIAGAAPGGVAAQISCADFRAFAAHGSPVLGRVTLVITNPPMGRRVRVPDLHAFVADLFDVAARVLAPGGRFVFANPTRIAPRGGALQLRYRQTVDVGGFACRVEKYVKPAAPAVTRAGRGPRR